MSKEIKNLESLLSTALTRGCFNNAQAVIALQASIDYYRVMEREHEEFGRINLELQAQIKRLREQTEIVNDKEVK